MYLKWPPHSYTEIKHILASLYTAIPKLNIHYIFQNKVLIISQCIHLEDIIQKFRISFSNMEATKMSRQGTTSQLIGLT